MLAEARQAEVDAYIAAFTSERDDHGRRLVVRNGYRESTESWADLLRDAKRRGMRAPVLAASDGALGFWGALREVFPETREQRCWSHKIANVLAALPKSAHPGAKKALAEMWNAEDRRHAPDAVTAFESAYGAKFPKAVAKITGPRSPRGRVLVLLVWGPRSSRGPLAGGAGRADRGGAGSAGRVVPTRQADPGHVRRQRPVGWRRRR
jgi:Transposase, Mutator family